MSVIHCFPLDRQGAEVKRCAGNLQRLNGELANAYWRREMQHLARRLRSIGQDESEISRQAVALTAAVQEELVRLSAQAAEAREM